MAYPTYRSRYQTPGPEDEYGYDQEDYNAPIQQRLAALLPQDDPEMDTRWRDAERRALDRSTEPQYGAAEGIRDFAPMAVGGLLDILVNKGKGLGALTAGGMQALSSENKRRDAARTQAAKEGLAIRGQREAGGDRKIGAMHALLRGDELTQRRAEQDARLGSPEEQAAKRAAELGLTAAQTKKYNADAENSGLDDIVRYMGVLGTQEGNAAKLALADRIAKSKEEENRLRREALDRKDREEAETKAGKLKVEQSGRFNKAVEKLVPYARSIRSADDVIYQARSTNPNADLPGIGVKWALVPFDMLPPEGKVLRNAVENMRQFKIRNDTGKAFTKAELAMMDAATSPGVTADSFLVGYNLMKRLATGALRRHSKAYEGVSRELLDAEDEGLYDWIQNPDRPPERGPSMVSPDAPPRMRSGYVQPAPGQPEPGQGQSPSAAPGPTTQATPTPAQRRQLRELMEQIPKGERDAVLGGISSLPIDEQIRALADMATKKLGSDAQDVITKTPADAAREQKRQEVLRKFGGKFKGGPR